MKASTFRIGVALAAVALAILTLTTGTTFGGGPAEHVAVIPEPEAPDFRDVRTPSEGLRLEPLTPRPYPVPRFDDHPVEGAWTTVRYAGLPEGPRVPEPAAPDLETTAPAEAWSPVSPRAVALPAPVAGPVVEAGLDGLRPLSSWSAPAAKVGPASSC